MGEERFAAELKQLSDFVAGAIGLHFPRSRWHALQRGLAETARELGFADAAECARQFLAGPASKEQISALAAHLTVGETYFMRERKGFDFLVDRIIPAIRRRNADGRELRIWSAACCTGEEAYSIAIVLREAIGDVSDWNITLLATDINSRFLRKAVAGIYGRWSFRQAPAGFRERYFQPVGEDHWEVLPHIKRLVRFAPLNLVNDSYPSPANAMDVVFCRNVLMYFTPEQAQSAVESLYRAQSEGGWLITGSGEMSGLSSGPYVAEDFRRSTYYRKCAATGPVETDRPIVAPSPERCVLEIPEAIAASKGEIPLIEKPAEPANGASKKAAKLRRAAHRLANRGRLAEALECCERWVSADRLNPLAHYLRGVIQQESGAIDDAVKSLRGAIYLDPDLVLAHFALGNIERNRGRRGDAEKHLENVRRLLNNYGPDEVLPESEGVTVARFIEIVNSLLEEEAVA